MLDNNDDVNRQVVPRWRSFAGAMRFGELGPLQGRPPDAFTDSMLEDALEDWERQPGLSVACDVVSAAFAIGRTERVRDIARFVVDHEDAFPLAKRIAARCLNEAPEQSVPDAFEGTAYGDVRVEWLRASISETRFRLNEYPVNPVLWTNLSLLHTIQGARDKAVREMQVALDLAPESRFVVRCASRLFLHHGDIDRAHDVLLKAPSLRHDPWLISGEIAIAAVEGRSSKLLTTAKRMVEAGSHSPFHLSELTSTLATFEAKSGNTKKAKKFCESSLAEPAENAIAQAIWLERNRHLNVRTSALLIDSRSSEAAAWAALTSGDLARSVSASKKWQNEQPFSSRPANFGSYVACLQDDFHEAEGMLLIARAANRDDPMLGNNLAFALANQGKVDEAARVLGMFLQGEYSAEIVLCLSATAGLVCFRAGQAEEGRRLYWRAIEIGEQNNLGPKIAVAKLHLALEELRLGAAEGAVILKDARDWAKELPAPLASIYLGKLKKAETAVAPPLVQ